MNWYRSGDRINDITFSSEFMLRMLSTKGSMVVVTCSLLLAI